MNGYLKNIGAVVGATVAGATIIGAGVWFYWLQTTNTKVLALAPTVFLETADDSLVATTDAGRVLGYRHKKGVLRYARIPFAAPPVGVLRFQPPQPVLPWSKVLDVRQPGPSCIQRTTRNSEPSQRQQSEDCLSLTVTTPSLEAANRPVIVWMHGGGLVAGSNGHSTYDGANFAARGDLVFVNVQYRLGSLGWLDVSSLGKDNVSSLGEDNVSSLEEDNVQQSSVNGQLDVLASLAWVQRNIDQFGGDPNNVTLMGESAGSFLVASLLSMPEAQPLFDKAILQSGVYNVWDIPVDRSGLLQRVLEQANVDSLEGLRQVDARVMQTLETDIYQFVRSQNFPSPMPWYSPRDITRETLEHSALNGKPILHGTLSQEHHSLLLSYTGNNPHGQIAQGLLGNLGLEAAQIDRLVAQIKPSLPDRSDQDLLVDLATAIHMHYPHAILSEQYATNAPVYSYLIDWAAPNFPELGAIHGLDLPLVFGNFDAWSWALGDNPPQELSDTMQAAWIAFAKTGNPNHATIPDWPLYEPEKRATMQFGETPEVVSDPLGWVRDLGPVMDDMLGKGR